MFKFKELSFYEQKALEYAEEYGIIEYKVKNNLMIKYHSFPYERTTYKSIINLDTMKETRTRLKRYYKPYKTIGKNYQTNYC